MGKYEKRDGIPPVPVRRKSQPEENHHRRHACRVRWHGRYPEAIHAETRRLRELAKIARQSRQGCHLLTLEQCEAEWHPGRCERAIKEGFRAAKEGRERHYAEALRRISREDEQRGQREREVETAWLWGYDLAEGTGGR